MLKTKYLIITLALCASSLLVAADDFRALLSRVSRGGPYRDSGDSGHLESQLYCVIASKQGVLSKDEYFGEALVFTRGKRSFKPLGKFNDMHQSEILRFINRMQNKKDRGGDCIHFTLQDTGDEELDGTLAVIYNTSDIHDAPRLEAQLAAQAAAKRAKAAEKAE